MTQKNQHSWSDARKMEIDPSSIAQHFDQFSDQYNQTVTNWGYDSPQIVAGLLKRFLQERSGNGDQNGPILDAGCGTGLAGRA